MKSGLKIFLMNLVSLLTIFAAEAQEHISLSSYSNQTEIKARGSVTLTDGFYIPSGRTVHVFTSPSFLQCVPFAGSPSANQNYISTRVFKVAGVNNTNIDNARSICEVNQTIQYLDDLGRPLQTVNVQGSPSFKDVVQPVVYDASGRESKKYLAYPASTGINGAFHTDGLSAQGLFYNSPVNGVTAIPNSAFSETKFEPSPLSRVDEQGAPGAVWQVGAGHTVKVVYGTNNIDEAYTSTGFAVRLYKALIGTGAARTLSNIGMYGTNELYLTIGKDENWVTADGKAGTVEEYKDKEGRIVLKRTFNRKTDLSIETLSTYYAYDDLGNLSFVLPPGASPDAGNITQTVLDNYCYQYRYDSRRRQIEKRVPGRDGFDYMVYNKLDQLVLSQDPRQRTSGQWLYIKYDMLGRMAITGIYSNASDRTTLQSTINGQTVDLWETRAANADYSNGAFPQTNTEVLTVNYYDDYSFPGGATYTYASASKNTKNLLTGNRVKVLETSTMLMSINFYDDEGRSVKVYKQHYLSGSQNAANYDEIENTYSFAGELTASGRIHHNGAAATTIANRYEYDHMGRKLATFESINGGTEVVLNKLDYNEIGQLLKKSVHSTDGTNFVQSNTYAYNERGWMKKINDPSVLDAGTVFGMELVYGNKPDAFNGNIGGINWKTKVPAGLGLTETLQSYVYDYDKLNRLKKAGYTTPGATDKFNEELEYDPMGNIASLKRKNTSTANTYLNDFTYNYVMNGVSSNRLQGVSDLGTATQGSTYTYDENGNQHTDSHKGITIDYNILNLPKIINKTSTAATLGYVYDATGQKLKKVYGTDTRDYIGGIEYNNGTIEFIQTEEGRALPGSSYTYEYMLKDHLGNTRATIKQNGDIVQVQDYYAFGLEMNPGNTTSPSPANRYTYNGKEKQVELGLDQLDYGARFYDPVIGRFSAIDPLSEKSRRSSPYNYVYNNPIRFIDPDGMMAVIPPSDFINEDGSKKHVEDGSTAQYKEVGKGINKHYEFTGFDELLSGLLPPFLTESNTVNLTTAIQEQQLLNDSNPALDPTSTATFCNYATQNVLSTVASATDNSSGLIMNGMANDMTIEFSSSPLLQNASQSKAKSTASDGNLALFGYYNSNPAPHNHGHVGSFSVGDNSNQGEVANVGARNGFLPLGPGKGSVFSKQLTLDKVNYFILNPTVTPKSIPVKTPSTNTYRLY